MGNQQATTPSTGLFNWTEALAALPLDQQPWPGVDTVLAEVASQPGAARCTDTRRWRGGEQLVYFFCDLHADADAFLLSLVASGGVVKTGDADADLALTAEGEAARFIIGGDCLDKGPSNFRLLDLVARLYELGADIVLLAGNHDLRTYLGILHADRKEPLYDHLFLRLGRKTLPLLAEIHQQLTPSQASALPAAGTDEALIRQRLLPDSDWATTFRQAASTLLSPPTLDKEIARMAVKASQFADHLARVGLDLVQLDKSLAAFRALFFEPGGRYHWFFARMQLAHREGAYLFVHAGVDDQVATRVRQQGVDALNRQFREDLATDAFGLYHGALGNVFRTKYRPVDFELTDQGVGQLYDCGVQALVHGHRNLLAGQQLSVRQGMLNFACDASVDCNTRRLEGLQGPGGAVVKVYPSGELHGVSTDCAAIKCFHPDLLRSVP